MKDLHARQEIAELLIGYASAFDRRDWRRMRSCFTTDAQIDFYPIGVFEGVESLVEFLTSSQPDTGHQLTQITNCDVLVDGSTATSRCYVNSVVMEVDGHSGLNPIGYFDDTLVRTDDGWRITSRKFTMVRLGRIEDPPGAMVSGWRM